MERHQMDEFAIEPCHAADLRIAQFPRALGDRVEHGLHIGRRARDDLQHFRRRRLLFQRLLGFVEQSNVLDRERRLVGEGLHQRDLLVGEGLRLRSPENDRADGTVLTHQRNRQNRPEAESRLIRPRVRVFVAEQRNDVLVVESLAVDDGAPHDNPPTQRLEFALLEYRHAAEAGRKAKLVSLEQKDSGLGRIAKPQRALGNGSEHRPHVRGRT